MLELWLGCTILVLSAGFWTNAGADANRWWTVVGAILGPLLVFRAWMRKPSTVECDTCGRHAPIESHIDDFDDFDHEAPFYIVACRHCGVHRAVPEAQ